MDFRGHHEAKQPLACKLQKPTAVTWNGSHVHAPGQGLQFSLEEHGALQSVHGKELPTYRNRKQPCHRGSNLMKALLICARHAARAYQTRFLPNRWRSRRSSSMSATKSSRAAKEPVRKATNLATWLRTGMGNCPMYFSAAFWLARSLQRNARISFTMTSNTSVLQNPAKHTYSLEIV